MFSKCDMLKVSSVVIKYPKFYILFPIIVCFICSYPTLLNIRNYKNWSTTNLSLLSKFDTEDNLISNQSNISLTQIWIQSNNDSTVLSKQFLLDSLALQTYLLSNISLDLLTVESPFVLWNNSLATLKNDKSPLQTINNNIYSIPRFLLQGVFKVNGYISSAKILIINIFMANEHHEHNIANLNSNLNKLKTISNITGFQILTSNYDNTAPNNKESVRVILMPLKRIDYLLIGFFYACLFFYVVHFMNTTHSVKSKGGVLTAMICQNVLTICSSITLTNFIFKSTLTTNINSIPWFLLILPISIISFNEMLRLLKFVNGSLLLSDISMKKAHNLGFDTKCFLECISETNFNSVIICIITMFIIVFFFPFSRESTCFFLIALIVNSILQLTYFTAILGMDYGRFSNKDILFLKNNDDDVTISLDNDIKLPKSNNWLTYIQNASNKFIIPNWLTLISVYLTFINIRFSLVRSSTSIIYKIIYGSVLKSIHFSRPRFRSIFDEVSLAKSLIKINNISSDSDGNNSLIYSLFMRNPIFIVKGGLDIPINSYSDQNIINTFGSSIFLSYRFDCYYFLEFFLLPTLLLASALLLLQLLVKSTEHNNTQIGYDLVTIEEEDKFTSKSENSKLSTSSSKPLMLGNSFHTKELSRNGHKLDIIKIYSSQSPFIVSIGMDHKIYVWSPLHKPIPNPVEIPLDNKFWPIIDVTISNNGKYIAFFNKLGKITCWSRKEMDFIWSIKVDHWDEEPLESFFRTKTSHIFLRNTKKDICSIDKGINPSLSKNQTPSRRNSSISVTSSQVKICGIDSSYESSKFCNVDEDHNDEFIFINKEGNINIISWDGTLKTQKLTTSKYQLKSCKKLVTPRINDRLIMLDEIDDIYVSIVINNNWKTHKLQIYRNTFNKGQGLMTPARLKHQTVQAISMKSFHIDNKIPLNSDSSILLVPFVGMILKANYDQAELIDVQTGTSIKKIQTNVFEPRSLKIFHDQPTHCKFCGAVSVSSLSIAYTAKSTSTMMMHTFQLESKTKTSICLRVERDPREIRCLGLESVVERKYELDNMEGWEVTENNTIIGIKRKAESINSQVGITSTLRLRSDLIPTTTLQKRNKTRRLNPVKSKSFKIHNVWEGWTMNVNGKIKIHKIPLGENGLLVNKIGPIRRFGTKYIVVGFGNIMKMFYLGHEELVLGSESSSNEENTGLKFVNKRRDRFTQKKISTNYNSLDPVLL